MSTLSISILLILFGSVISIYGFINYRKAGEWEMWAPKLKAIATMIIGELMFVSGAGLLIYFYNFQ
ncbi:MAG: hypothetical protein SFU91_10490 [Chloroherpetonaceae bacterium]|nr:hypothetical protein [Chloroherpetonaceae bacterium]